MIRFTAPEAFLLLPLAWLVLRARLWPRPFVGALRVLLLVAAAAMLAEPWWPGEQDGRDVVVVLDRSRSMPPDAPARAAEFARAITERVEPGDRIGVVTFGKKPAVELVPTMPFHWPAETRPIDADGSDLAAAVDAGLSVIAPGRQGSLLIVSDGEHTGSDLDAAARAALRAGVRIDAVVLARPPGDDVAVADVLAPAEVAVGEPFVLSAIATAASPGPAHYRVLADGDVVREGDVELVAGRNVLQFRRAPTAPGLSTYAVEVTRPGDAVPQNDRGLAVVRGVAAPRVLCVTPGGREDRLTRSLRGLGLEVVVHDARSAPLSLDQLDAVRCVVLEDVPAGDLPRNGIQALATWVEHLGGGLLMTGGRASFGVGGYHKTRVETVLPVTMEMREEQRRFGLAMAIALDRSGSMQMSVGAETKMQLADRGAATAVELLSPMDSVAVIAVDSGPHVVVDLQPVTDAQEISSRVRSIESSGGGIYIGEALHAAATELGKATQKNRHIVLFADAADSEQPDDYKTFVPELAKAGVTVSVIGLGQDTDSDAELLKEIAELGNGRCEFVADPTDLPRVFAQETIQVARSAIVEEPTGVAVHGAMASIGEMPAAFPGVGGYSLAWRRDRAELDLETTDAQKAPLLTHWQVGLGRAAAYLGEVDGELAGGFASWERTGDFLGTLVRWLCGGQAPGLFVSTRRDGDVGVVTVEVERELAPALDAAEGVVTDPEGHTHELVFERVADDRLVAHVPLAGDGVFRPALRVAGATVRVPPLLLPYSAEYAVRPDPRAGERALRHLTTTTGGRLQPLAEDVLRGSRAGRGRIDLTWWCAIAAFALLFAEIVVRRFGLTLPSPFRRRRAVVGAEDPAAAPAEVRARKAKPAKAEKAAPAAPAEPGNDLLSALERAAQKRRR